MKKILLIILLFVNLQVTIKGHVFVLVAGSEIFAQRMEEADIDYYCNDDEVGWYRSPIPCDGVHVVATIKSQDENACVGGDTSRSYNASAPSSSTSGCSASGGGGGSNTSSEEKTDEKKVSQSVEEKHVKKTSCPNDPPKWSRNSPTCFEGAVMSELVYKDKETYESCLHYLTGKGWTVADDEAAKMGLVLHDKRSGLDCTLLKNASGKGYALVFAGTQPKKMNITSSNLPFLANPYSTVMDKIFSVLSVSPDIKTDAFQYLYGMDAQYYQAMCNAILLAESLGNVQITFVGHSLGGGEAAMASIVTGCPALTYNPAALSDKTMEQLANIGKGNDTSHIYRYIMEGDPLTNSQRIESQGTRMHVTNFTQGAAHVCTTMIDNISCDEYIEWPKDK